MDCKERLEAYLREHDVQYHVQTHPVAYTAQKIAEVEHIPGHMVMKVVMVVGDGKLVMLAAPASRQVDMDAVRSILDAEDVRFANEQEFARAFPDCELGAMPPFGNLYNIPVYVDKAMTENEMIIFQAGNHTETISMKYEDFERLVRPIVAELTFQWRMGKAA